MTREEAHVLGVAVKTMLADSGWDGYTVSIGLDDDGIAQPVRATGWYVRIDRADDAAAGWQEDGS